MDGEIPSGNCVEVHLGGFTGGGNLRIARKVAAQISSSFPEIFDNF